MRADTDGNGVSDGNEVSRGCNPLNAGSTPVPSEEMLAVNAGGAQYVGVDGTVYGADTWFSGGSTYTMTAAIAGITDDRLYQSERCGNFSYKIPVANGDYLITLKSSDNYWSQVGQRVFNRVHLDL
jgi:Malectin domain